MTTLTTTTTTTATTTTTESERLLGSRDLLLLFPTKHLGNFLIALAPIQALSIERHKRGLKTTLAAVPGFTALLPNDTPGLELIDFSGDIHRGTPLFRRTTLWLSFVYRMRKNKAGLLLDLESTPRSANLARASGARWKVGRERRKKPLRGFDQLVQVGGPGQHAWHEFRDMLGLTEILEGDPAYGQLAPPEESLLTLENRFSVISRAIDQGEGALIGLHPGATKNYKMWPLDHYAELARQLVAAGHRVVLLGAGSSDARSASLIEAELSGNITNLCDALSLGELAALMSRLDVYVGNDSGPAHLAGAAGTPAVVLFGPTDLRTWGPISPHSHVLTAHCPCKPGQRKSRCSNYFKCIRGIPVEQVKDEVNSLLLDALAPAGSQPA